MRTFKNDTTYETPRLWVDSEGNYWKGPISPDNTLHFARFCGRVEDTYEEIWVLESSECPEDCVLIEPGYWIAEHLIMEQKELISVHLNDFMIFGYDLPIGLPSRDYKLIKRIDIDSGEY